MPPKPPDTDELLRRTSQGSAGARDQLLARHRARLRKLVSYHLDRRLAARVDPSDVVQDVLIEAAHKLSDYIRDRPLPFYPWLRQIACDRLIELHRQHVQAQKRSVRREEPGALALPDESLAELAGRLVSNATSPSERLLRKEIQERIRAALTQLSGRDREVLELRHLEQLSVAETAAILGITQAGVKSRHLRALQRLQELLARPKEET
jgi:RNA polymerase sigma-70 factor (ECF subfamily)